MAIDYKRFLDNEKYKVTVAGLTGGSVSTVLQNDIAIAGGNDFTTTGDIISELPVLGKAKALKDRGAAVIKATGRSIVSQFETALVWNNSLKPTFTLDMTFYQANVNDEDILKQYMRLKSAVLPTSRGAFFKAPLGYRIGSFKRKTLKPQGTIVISIGEWFQATNMVMTSENFNIAKEVNSKGQPLFITGSITLEPYKAITYEEFKDYFIGI